MEQYVGRAIIIGGSSGIGLEIAKQLYRENYSVAITARDARKLSEVKKENPDFIIKVFDAGAEDSQTQFENLISEMGGMTLFVYAAGILKSNPLLEWPVEEQMLRPGIIGFTKLMGFALHYFILIGKGHIVGITSVAAIRGSRNSPAYNASKAYQSNYLEGLRMKAQKRSDRIHVTEVRPGYVDTAMVTGIKHRWMIGPDEAALGILKAIDQKKKRVYIPAKWCLTGWLLGWLPYTIYFRVKG